MSEEQPYTVSGMLLYGQTDEDVKPSHMYHVIGNKIRVRTLDLNRPFKEIVAQLDDVVEDHFAEKL